MTRLRRKDRWLLVVAQALMCAMGVGAWGQAAQGVAVDPRHVDGTTLGTVFDLSQVWLMKAGDDPHWADPKLDDSQWVTVTAGKPAAAYGFKNVNRVWYRAHVTIRPGQQNISLMVRNFAGSYQLFVNGTEIGSFLPKLPGGSGTTNFDQSFVVPAAALASGELTIAIRASIARASEYGKRQGGIASYTVVWLGPSRIVGELTSLYAFRSFSSNSLNILTELLIPLLALALALTLPKELEYSALVLSGGASVISDMAVTWRLYHNSPPDLWWFFFSSALGAVAVVSSLEFVRLVLGLRRSRLWAGYEYLLGGLLAVAVPFVNHFFAAGGAGPSGGILIGVIVFASLLQLPFSIGLPVLALWVWWRRRNPDALLLFVPLFLSAVVQYCEFGLFLLNRMHVTNMAALPNVPTHLFFLKWSEVSNFLFTVALLLFLVLRTVRIAKSRAAMASDLHAVQSVQEILLARASHDTPGFRIEHVYHPASEVGGDFFLVSPGPDGSVTAIVGDVSGKGLVAAMRVSMILGVLRREEHREPDAVLRGLNDALLMQGEMGFTTACCVRMEPDGRYTIANAGHISPYVGGEEIVTPSSLPLGMVEDQVYEQVEGVLPDGKTLVMMSDGVVEARSKKGELYGFARLRDLTLMKAEDIADVARRFGQEDDITVLTIARPVVEAEPVRAATLVTAGA